MDNQIKQLHEIQAEEAKFDIRGVEISFSIKGIG